MLLYFGFYWRLLFLNLNHFSQNELVQSGMGDPSQPIQASSLEGHPCWSVVLESHSTTSFCSAGEEHHAGWSPPRCWSQTKCALATIHLWWNKRQWNAVGGTQESGGLALILAQFDLRQATSVPKTSDSSSQKQASWKSLLNSKLFCFSRIMWLRKILQGQPTYKRDKGSIVFIEEDWKGLEYPSPLT